MTLYTELVLIEFIIMIINYFASAYLFLRCLLSCLKSQVKTKIDYAPLLLNYLFIAFLICATSIVHIGYMIAFWRPSKFIDIGEGNVWQVLGRRKSVIDIHGEGGQIWIPLPVNRPGEKGIRGKGWGSPAQK
jgi:hypothetical protein